MARPNPYAVRIDPAPRGRHVYAVVNRYTRAVVAGPYPTMRDAFDEARRLDAQHQRHTPG